MRLNKFPSFICVLACLAVFFAASQSAQATAKKSKTAKPAQSATSKKVIPYPPEFYEAQKLALREKKYKEAYDMFDRLDQNGFCRDKTHYYMALCLHNMNQTQQAAQHYQVVYNYSKDPQLRYLAAVGYGQVAKYAANRKYAGQGNLFARVSTGKSNAAGPWGSSADASGSASASGPWGGGGGAVCGPRG